MNKENLICLLNNTLVHVILVPRQPPPSPPHYCVRPLCGFMSLISQNKHAHCSMSESRKPLFCNRVLYRIHSGIMFYSFAVAITDVWHIIVRHICVY